MSENGEVPNAGENGQVTENQQVVDEAVHKRAESADPSKMEDPGCSKLFVRGFPTDCEEADIAQYFETWGKVIRVDIKKDYNSNESRGFGFVTMATPAEFKKVMEHSEPHRIKDQELIIKEAKESLRNPQGKGESSWGGKGGGGGGWWDGGGYGGGGKGKGKGKGKGGGKGDMASMMMKMMGMGGTESGGWGGGDWGDSWGKGGGAQHKHKEDNRKIFVGGLSGDCEESHLRDHFAQFGEITLVELKMHPHTGKCKGFAFITFTSEEAAQKAIDNREGNIIMNKWVDVKTCGDKQHGENPMGTPGERTVFVGGLPWDITTEKLQSHFDKFGRIQKLDLKMNEQTGRPRGFAFIIFADTEAAETCMKQSVHNVEGHSVDVKRAIPTSEKKKDGEDGAAGGGAAAWGSMYGSGGDVNAAQAAQYQQALQQQQQLLMYQQHLMAQQQLVAAQSAASGGDPTAAATDPTAAAYMQQYMAAYQAMAAQGGAGGADAYGAASGGAAGALANNRFNPY